LKAVINASVLIVLGKLGYLGLLKQLFDKLVIAKSVFEEVREKEVLMEINNLVDAGFAQVAETSKRELLEVLSFSLGKGEAETIALTLDIKVGNALLDDLRARKMARRMGVKVTGTLGVLKALINRESIQEKPEDLCKKLIGEDFWIEKELCIKILRDP